LDILVVVAGAAQDIAKHTKIKEVTEVKIALDSRIISLPPFYLDLAPAIIEEFCIRQQTYQAWK
jgi:hypothetical protein